MKRTSSNKDSLSATSWVDMTMVCEPTRYSETMARSTLEREGGSIPERGSSRSTSPAERLIATVILRRARIPLDNLPTLASGSSPMNSTSSLGPVPIPIPVKASDVIEDLPHAHPAVEVVDLRHVGQPALWSWARGVPRRSEILPRIGMVQAGDQLEQRRLPLPFGPRSPRIVPSRMV